MPRRKRASKRRALSPAERLDEALADLPPNPLVRRGVDALGLDDEVVLDGDAAIGEAAGLDDFEEPAGRGDELNGAS